MITNAIDVFALTQSSFATALLDPQAGCPEDLRTWNGADPSVRLGVYRNNVVSGLIDALVESFPVTRALVGDEYFRAMASVFVRQHPPRTRILGHYGIHFPAFIDQFEPARCMPYLGDVARLEAARVSAYHAADCDPVDPDRVQAVLGNGEDLDSLRLLFHPSVSLLDSLYAVVSLWSAHQVIGEVDLSEVDVDKPEGAMILRQALDVVVIAVPVGVARFAAALRDGAGLGKCAADSIASTPDFDLSGALSILFHHGAVASIVIPSEGKA